MQKSAGAFLLLFILAGCASTYNFVGKIDETRGVRSIYRHGYQVPESVGNKSSVALSAHFEQTPYNTMDRNHIALVIDYRNTSNQRIDIVPETITVLARKKNGKTYKLKTYAGQEYINKLQNQQTWSAIGAALNAGLAGYNARQPYWSASDRAAWGNAAKQQSKYAEKIADESGEVLSSTSDKLLGTTTLYPNERISGKVMVQWMEGVEYLVRIPVADEIHEIELNLHRQ